MILKEIIILLLAHFLYDFIFQPYSISSTKALKTLSMGKHITIVFIVTLGAVFVLTQKWSISLLYALIYSFTHFITDTFLWNGYKKLRDYDTTYKFWQDHVWYKFLAVDQLSHIAVLCYLYITLI